MTTLKQYLLEAEKYLVTVGIENARFDIGCMMADVLKTKLGQLPLIWHKDVDQNFEDKLNAMIARRCQHEPLQYIIGNWDFVNLELTTKPGALIPRPETEEVFLAAIEFINKSNFTNNFIFADIGTGTGALGLAVSQRFIGSKGFLADISNEALAIAKNNISRYPELAKRITLIKSDLLSAFQPESLDMIISNPPYIPSTEIKALMPEVRDFEPHLALDGGKDGLDIIERLIKESSYTLKQNGLLIFEHGDKQRSQIRKLIDKTFTECKAGNDLGKHERYFVLKRI